MILFYLIQKEFKQLLRNRLLPVLFVLVPLLLVNGVPRLATQEVKGIHFVVVDNDHSSTTRRLIHKLDASAYLSLTSAVGSYKEAMELISSGEADAIIEFPHGYEKCLVTHQALPQVQLSANSINGIKGSISSVYIMQIIQDMLSDVPLTVLSDGRSLQTSYLYNENLDYKLYMTPVIFALLLILIVGFLPALNIVGEKERGTIEQINVTPIGKVEFIVSKIIPYIVVGLFMTLESVIAARVFHGISPAGSVVTLLIFALLFCMLAASLGLVVSNYSSTLQQAALTMYFFLVIFILLSGLLTPIQSMPQWAQTLTCLNPMRYMIEAMRAIFIKGSSLWQLRSQFVALTLFTLVGWFWAIRSYRKNEF